MGLPEQLRQLEGRWVGAEDHAPSPWLPGGRADAELVFRLGAGGTVLLQDYESRPEGRPALSGHGVLSVAPEAEELHWHWFDSLGFASTEPARGHWTDHRLALERRSPRGANRTTWVTDEDTLEQIVEFRAADADDFVLVSRGRYTRAP